MNLVRASFVFSRSNGAAMIFAKSRRSFDQTFARLFQQCSVLLAHDHLILRIGGKSADLALEDNLADVEPIAQKMGERAAGDFGTI